MVYIENLWVCFAAPMVLLLAILKGGARRLNLFLVLGMAACVLASYGNTFLAGAFGMEAGEASVRVTPFCEELIKALPVLFYAAVFEPKREDAVAAGLAVGVGFAMLENVCFIVQYGDTSFFYMVLRGLAAGVMHAFCTGLVGFGVGCLRAKRKLAITGTFAVLCAAITWHAVYNLLAGGGGWPLAVACAAQLLPVAAVLLSRRKHRRLRHRLYV